VSATGTCRSRSLAATTACLAFSLALLLNVASDIDRPAAIAATQEAVDTALVLAVDVSDSVDAKRYQLQMEGIAQALEDRAVINSIMSGHHGAILVTLVAWSDRAEIALPWQKIASIADGERVAGLVRTLPHRKGEYTCMARMIVSVRDTVLETLPLPAERAVLDVSGDGIDNCADPSESEAARDRLLRKGATINGLPILVKGENDIVGSGAYRAPGYGLRALPDGAVGAATTLDAWFEAHVIGGPAAFLLTAEGYEDFGRAFRRKFVTEISASDRCVAAAALDEIELCGKDSRCSGASIAWPRASAGIETIRAGLTALDRPSR